MQNINIGQRHESKQTTSFNETTTTKEKEVWQRSMWKMIYENKFLMINVDTLDKPDS